MNFKFSSLDKIVWWFSDENEISASFAIQFDSGGDAVVCCFWTEDESFNENQSILCICIDIECTIYVLGK